MQTKIAALKITQLGPSLHLLFPQQTPLPSPQGLWLPHIPVSAPACQWAPDPTPLRSSQLLLPLTSPFSPFSYEELLY